MIPWAFANVSICKYEVPSYWAIGKVYARLVEDVASDNVVQTVMQVFSSPISDVISNFNSDFFYQPRGYIKQCFLTPEEIMNEA